MSRTCRQTVRRQTNSHSIFEPLEGRQLMSAGDLDKTFAGAGWTDTPVLDRAELGEVPRAGPVIVQEYDATCLVPPGMDVSRDGFGNLVLRRAG